MPEYEYGSRRSVRKRHLYLVLLYAAILLALVAFWLIRGRQDDSEEVFGSLNGRFESEIAMEYGGKTLHYRENEILNYLLIGMDRQAFEAVGTQEGGQADFLLVLNIDRRNRTITPVMIDRDTMAEVTTYGIFGNAAGSRTMQICLAQAYSGTDVSGSENTARAVSDLLWNVRINRCMVMDLGGIRLLNDAVGGVTVTLEDDLTALDPALKKGETVLLQGDLAEHFVRGRMTVADGTNASRMRRQQTYIEALVAQLADMLERDEDLFADIYDSLSGHVQTDVSRNVLLGEVNAYGDYEWQPLRTLQGQHTYGEDGFAEFWMDEQTAMDLVAEIWFA